MQMCTCVCVFRPFSMLQFCPFFCSTYSLLLFSTLVITFGQYESSYIYIMMYQPVLSPSSNLCDSFAHSLSRTDDESSLNVLTKSLDVAILCGIYCSAWVVASAWPLRVPCRFHSTWSCWSDQGTKNHPTLCDMYSNSITIISRLLNIGRFLFSSVRRSSGGPSS